MGAHEDHEEGATMATEVVAATRGAENRGGAVKGEGDAALGQPLQIASDGIPDNEVDAV